MMKIGMIGLDTSHVVHFTRLLNDPSHEHHVAGGKVVAAYPGGSPDFEQSIGRVEGFTKQLSQEFGVDIADSPEAVAERCDAIMLESVDGRVHLEQFQRIAKYGKPVFIDKPFTVNAQEAEEIARLAQQYGVPVMSSSALRFAEALTSALSESDDDIIGADTFGPMNLQATQPGYFWYGIHAVEMLFAALGRGCVQVQAIATEDHDVIVGQWSDGRIGTVRGNRKGNAKFGAVLHRAKASQFVDIHANPKPYYASLLERIMTLFTTGHAAVSIEETLDVIRFIEAANKSRASGNIERL